MAWIDTELREHKRQRHEIARLRLEWELLKFALKGRKAGFNPAQARDDHGRWVNGAARPISARLGGETRCGKHAVWLNTLSTRLSVPERIQGPATNKRLCAMLIAWLADRSRR